jgi:hypothetical protein
MAKTERAVHLVRTAGPSAAVSAIPGVTFLGDRDGTLCALSTLDGRMIIWEYDTAQECERWVHRFREVRQ